MKPFFAIPLALALLMQPAFSSDEQTAWDNLQNETAQLTEGLPQDEVAGKKLLTERLRTQSEHFKEFTEKFPKGANRWEARMAVLQIANSLDMIEGREPDLSAQASELQSIANDKDAPENIRADAGLVLLQIASLQFDKERTEASARSLSAAIGKFLETHPDDARAPALKLTEAQALETFDPARARTLYEETAKSEEQEISEAAKSGLEMMDMRGKPLELSFTAVDGRKVDLAGLRGKVVLVDFWATWCPPCVEEAPNVVAAYEKFKDKGFEIVGISLDENKDALEAFTKKHNMTWTQFFDGKKWDNELAQRFKIQSVPTMWLLDREGKLADPAPRGRLDEAIQAALDKR